MKYYKFWTKIPLFITKNGKDFSIFIKGHSNISIEDAIANAESRKDEITEMVRDDIYETSNTELIEEFIEDLSQMGREIVVTRNRYGSQILNCEDIIITDNDLPVRAPFFYSIFHKVPRDKSSLLEHLKATLIKKNMTGRIYETKNGFRCIITNTFVKGGTPESLSILKDFFCDQLYISMTKVQQCYRARLTPKPFRVKIPKPPIKFPYGSDQEKDLMNSWKEKYESASSGYSSCKFVDEVGSCSDSYLRTIIEKHDEITGALKNLPLA